MEVEVGVEGSEEGTIEDNGADKLGSDSDPLKQVADPVVYKLVRVDIDGRLVPATDDELMEVENLMELEESEVLSMSDIVESEGQGLNKDGTCEKPLLTKLEGSLEDKIAEVDEIKLEAPLEETMDTPALNVNDRQETLSENNGQESSLKDGSSKRGCGGSKPDFSWLKGEINLEKLTIRELQETFKAAFGRETSVKDKMWLRRRIAMGLTNSCDVSVTSFIVRDGKFFKQDNICKNVDCEDSVAGEVMSAGNDTPVGCQNAIDDAVDGAESRNSVMESGRGSDDAAEQKGAKRVRKPTKRYIEELSDKETREVTGKSPVAKGVEHHKGSLRLPVSTTLGVHPGTTISRTDSLGGSGIRVPYVSRVRRCRPRKNVMPFMKFRTSPIASGNTADNSVFVTLSNEQPDDLGEDKVMVVKSLSSEETIVSEDEKERPLAGVLAVSQDREPTNVDSRDNSLKDNTATVNSDDNAAIAPALKGGMRRKHHRAWTLTEVVKLVDGVSKFGAGRWSEIKRLSFSSSPYRTSVDLKDKWRNLLKASFASSPSEKGVNPRKNVPSPIPAPILVKVRELAELNGQAPRIVKAASSGNSGSSNVNESRSGYL